MTIDERLRLIAQLLILAQKYPDRLAKILPQIETLRKEGDK